MILPNSGVAKKNWWLLNHFLAFSMKMSRACFGMLSSENNDFTFFKTAKNIKCTCITCTNGTVLSLQTSLSFSRNMNVTIAKELYYIFSKKKNEISMLVTFH